MHPNSSSGGPRKTPEGDEGQAFSRAGTHKYLSRYERFVCRLRASAHGSLSPMNLA